MMYGSDMTIAVCCCAWARAMQKGNCLPRSELQGVPGGSSVDYSKGRWTGRFSAKRMLTAVGGEYCEG